MLVAIAEKRKAPRPQEHHFEKQLEALCPYHEKPVKHKLRDCRLMRSFLASPGLAPPHYRLHSGSRTTSGSPEPSPSCFCSVSRTTSGFPSSPHFALASGLPELAPPPFQLSSGSRTTLGRPSCLCLARAHERPPGRPSCLCLARAHVRPPSCPVLSPTPTSTTSSTSSCADPTGFSYQRANGADFTGIQNSADLQQLQQAVNFCLNHCRTDSDPVIDITTTHTIFDKKAKSSDFSVTTPSFKGYKSYEP